MEEYDVYISENFDMCGIGLAHLITPRALITASASAPIAWMNDEVGLPRALSYNPSEYLEMHTCKRVNCQHFQNSLFWSISGFSESFTLIINTGPRKEFGPDFPSMMEISSHAAYTFIYEEPLIDFAYPTLSRIVYLGGIGAR
ncbi:hypothetical protein PMAYCL1PPCAC_08040, partial [Pristionchus mayeri]